MNTKISVRVEFDIDIHWGDHSRAHDAAKRAIENFFKQEINSLPPHIARTPHDGHKWISNMTGQYAVDVWLNPEIAFLENGE